MVQILVPAFAQEEPSAALKERDELLAKAEASVRMAVKDDRERPIYHVLPPANWMNDPNGPIYHAGYYHLFYQHNPYGDQWGNMHWGHVRSRDLVEWEHLPIALWPSKSKGEEHVFSGCATVTKSGQVMLFYTSIGKRAPEQWAVVPEDDDLIRWRKHPANPLLSEKLHGETRIYEWRDPFIFHHGQRTYLVCGGNLNNNAGGKAAVLVYRAANDELTEWKYLGVLFQHPDAAVKNIECPLFFPLGEKWVLIVSPHAAVQYFVGDLKSEDSDRGEIRFVPEQRGVMDHGSYYAPNVMFDREGRSLLWGWIRDFPAGRGWNGCLTLPRELTLGGDGRLQQRPVKEIQKLAGSSLKMGATQFGETPRGLSSSKVTGAFRVECEAELGEAKEVMCSIMPGKDEKRRIRIRYDGRELDVAGAKGVLVLGAGEALRLQVFVDHSVLEVYANERVCVSRVIPASKENDAQEVDRGGVAIEFTARGGDAKLAQASLAPLRTIWKAVQPK